MQLAAAVPIFMRAECPKGRMSVKTDMLIFVFAKIPQRNKFSNTFLRVKNGKSFILTLKIETIELKKNNYLFKFAVRVPAAKLPGLAGLKKKIVSPCSFGSSFSALPK
jgi:hypothetical protein